MLKFTIPPYHDDRIVVLGQVFYKFLLPNPIINDRDKGENTKQSEGTDDARRQNLVHVLYRSQTSTSITVHKNWEGPCQPS